MEVKEYNLTDYIDMHRSISILRQVKAVRAVGHKEQETLRKWGF